jgi:hypothetical protein
MPIETTPQSKLQYFLLAFDVQGNERMDDPDGRMSAKLIEALQRDPVTDVFVLSHGWQGDVPGGRAQYDNWIDAMAACTADLEEMKQARPGFHPVIVGLHWPSKAWGEEEFGGGGDQVSFGLPTTDPVEMLVDQYAERLDATPEMRAALRTIIVSAMQETAPDQLPPEVRDAYLVVDANSSLESKGEGADPGADREPFDPDKVYEAAQEQLSFGGFSLGGLLAPLRTLTFWKMKDRAKKFGETAGFNLLQQIQKATGERVKVHLMGHSFGCIVVSAILADPDGRGSLVRPVDSLALIQGALSLWSFCSDIPMAKGRSGFFRSIVEEKKVRGPIITTMSALDTAVGRFYPLGAGARGDVSFAPGELPKYGAVGKWGARGPGLKIVDLEMQPANVPYKMEAGTVYNLESSRYIREGGGFSGAHNDIARPEVAHAFWSAARGAV